MMINFPLTLYVVNDHNEIKIILKEGTAYLFYTVNIHKSRNKNSQHFLAQMTSKVTHKKRQRKICNSCNKPNYLKETCILSFFVSLLEKRMKLTLLLRNMSKQGMES